MSRLSGSIVLGLALSVGAGACTAILVPDEDDDGVARCDVTNDCPPTGDTRYAAVCVLWDDKDDAADKICVADFRDVPCGSNVYGATHPLTHNFLLARSKLSSYAACVPDALGSLGCGPNEEGGCDAGLELNPYGTCDDPEAPMFTVGVGQVDLDEIVGREVQDQFCRSFFCDDSFVCSNRGTRPTCVLCDRTRYFGSGGCGTLHVGGEPAWAYLDTEATGNCAGQLDDTQIMFGAPLPP